MKFFIALLIAYFSISPAHAKGVSDIEYTKAKSFVNSFDERIKNLPWDNEVNKKGWRSCADMDRYMMAAKDAQIKKSFAKKLREDKACIPFIKFKANLTRKNNNYLSAIALYEKEKLTSTNKEINIISGKLKAQGIKLESNTQASTIGDAEKTLNVMTNKLETIIRRNNLEKKNKLETIRRNNLEKKNRLETIRRNDLEKKNQQAQRREHQLKLEKMIPTENNDGLTDVQRLGGSIYSLFDKKNDNGHSYVYSSTLEHWKKVTSSKKDLLLNITLECSAKRLNNYPAKYHKEFTDIYYKFAMKHKFPLEKQLAPYFPKDELYSDELAYKRMNFMNLSKGIKDCVEIKVRGVVAENEEKEKLKLLSKKQLGELAIAKKDYENFKVKHKTVIAKNGLLNPNASLAESKIMVTLIRKGLTVEFIKEGVSKRVVDFCWNKFAPMTDEVSECVVFNMLRG